MLLLLSKEESKGRWKNLGIVTAGNAGNGAKNIGMTIKSQKRRDDSGISVILEDGKGQKFKFESYPEITGPSDLSDL